MGHTRKLGYLPPCVAGGWVPLLAHVLILLLTLFSFAVHAADPLCKEYQFVNAGWFKTPQEACDAWASKAQVSQITPAFQFRNWVHSLSGSGASATCYLQWDYAYLGSSTWMVTGMGSGSVQVREVVCEEVCKPGPKGSVNVTVGYHATPSTNIKLNPLVKADPFFKQLEKDRGGTMCYQGCKVGVHLPDEGADWWVSQVAGPNGLYRSSATIDIQGTSQQCSEAIPDAVTSTATPPACPGATSNVNGATVCLPSTTDTTPGTAPTDAIRGNPSAGPTDPSKPTSERAPGPGGAGNGSGTGGASNGGGASGGPATGSNNTPGGKGCNDGSKSPELPCSGKGELDADGTTDKPGEDKEQQACGAPGQPKCRIDETGTPDGKDAFNSAKEKLDSEFDKLTTELEKIKSPDGKDTSWGVMPTWIQTGACSPWNLGTLPIIDRQITIDICAIKPYVDGVMNFLWALGTFFAVISMVFRVTTNTSS